MRVVIVEKLGVEAVELEEEVEVDESYFGGVRKGKRGRGAAGKIPVFGLLKRGGRVYTITGKDAKANTLFSIVTCKVQPDSIVYTDSYGPDDTLKITDFRHMRINRSKLFANKQHHINSIENFCNQAKRHLSQYNGAPARTSISSSKNASGASTTVRLISFLKSYVLGSSRI